MERGIKDAFDKFWEAYPLRNGKKVGKQAAFEKFSRIITQAISDSDFDALMLALQNYAAAEQCKRGYVKDPVRFLAADYWRDWITPEHKPLTPQQEAKRDTLKAELRGLYGKQARKQNWLNACPEGDIRREKLLADLAKLTARMEQIEVELRKTS